MLGTKRWRNCYSSEDVSLLQHAPVLVTEYIFSRSRRHYVVVDVYKLAIEVGVTMPLVPGFEASGLEPIKPDVSLTQQDLDFLKPSSICIHPHEERLFSDSRSVIRI